MAGADERRTFISWSGGLARDIAIGLQSWLKDVLQPSTSFVSSEDIGKGTFWSARILEELASCRSGIVVVTPDNFKAPWLNFEAGALVNGVTEAGTQPTVCPLLIDVQPGSLPTPMSLLQVTKVDLADIRKMVVALNNTLVSPLAADTVKRSVERWWDDLIKMIEDAKVKNASAPPVAEPGTEEMLKEVLELTRAAASEQGTRGGVSKTNLGRDQLDADFEYVFDHLVNNYGKINSAEVFAYDQWLQTGRFRKAVEDATEEFKRNPELWMKVRTLTGNNVFRDAIQRRVLTKHDIARLATTYGLGNQAVDAGSLVQILMRHVEVMGMIERDELDQAAGIVPYVSPAMQQVVTEEYEAEKHQHHEDETELMTQAGLSADGR